MEFFHVLNRGVEKRNIVEDDKDRLRFLHDLFVFNDSQTVANYILPERHTEHPRKLLVHIHSFCLMDNHYHLLLSPIQENGISLFMQKLNMGYTKYFNEKYKRSGALWQGKHKKILIQKDAHFLYIPYYIHLNPLDYTHPEWRKGKVTNIKNALETLRSYRWSSHLDYAGSKNFPSIIDQNFLREVVGPPAKYEKEIQNIITNSELTKGSLRLESGTRTSDVLV